MPVSIGAGASRALPRGRQCGDAAQDPRPGCRGQHHDRLEHQEAAALDARLDGRRLPFQQAERGASIRALVERDARGEVPELIGVGMIAGRRLRRRLRMSEEPSCSIAVSLAAHVGGGDRDLVPVEALPVLLGGQAVPEEALHPEFEGVARRIDEVELERRRGARRRRNRSGPRTRGRRSRPSSAPRS